MGTRLKLVLATFFLFTLVLLGIYWLMQKPVPETIQYGVSFNTLYARELGLNWQEAYDAILDELGVRRLRLAAHWDMVEQEQGEYNFTELDYQIKRAEEVGATVVFGVGRRLPRWPECHIPAWAEGLSWEKQQAEILQYIEATVLRYKDSPVITYWQVENEPYLNLFANEHCGDLDEKFLLEEIELVRSLDPTRPILLTDSGNLGTWLGPYKHGDAFGTSVYLYFWNPELGQFRTALPPWFYRLKEGLVELMYGEKPTFLIELSAEPWLLEPVVDVPLEVQYERMNPDKFTEILEYARETRYEVQYLWGAEWWYWLTLQGETAMWDKGQELFGNDTAYVPVVGSESD